MPRNEEVVVTTWQSPSYLARIELITGTEILSDNISVDSGVPFTISATLRTSETQNAIPNETIYLYINNVLIAELTTDAYGKVSYTTTLVTAGLYSLKLEYVGTIALRGATTFNTITITTPAPPPECSPDGITRCSGYTLQSCQNGKWVTVEDNSTSCGYVPPAPTCYYNAVGYQVGATVCQGVNRYQCMSNGTWLLVQENDTTCGYVPPTPMCYYNEICYPEGAMICQGTDRYQCMSNGIWNLVQENDTTCGYVPPGPEPPEPEPSEDAWVWILLAVALFISILNG